MIKFVTLALVGVMGIAAQAELITCNFTEPFLTVKIETKTGKVVFKNFDNKAVRGKEISFFRNAELVQSQFTVAKVDYTLNIDLKKKGSDGMSSLVYPIEGMLMNYYPQATENADLFGGCFTKKLKPSCEDGAENCR